MNAKIRKPELLISFSNFPNGGDSAVILRESGLPFTLARCVGAKVLPTRLSDADAKKIIYYNQMIETKAGAQAISRARRRLPASVRGLVYE